MNQWDLPIVDLRFCDPCRRLTKEFSNLGFEHHALTYVPLAMSGTHWRSGDMLLRICHSPWVTHTGVMMVIHSCMYVTCCGCHTIET